MTGIDKYLNKIIQGDCLKILKQLPDESIDCVITSPPYNKHSADIKCYKSSTWRYANISFDGFKDNLPEEEYQEQQKQVVRELVRIIKLRGSIFYNHKVRVRNHKAIIPTEWLSEFNIRQVLIWDKGGSYQLAPIRWLPSTEYIYWITKSNIQPKFYRRSKHKLEVIRIPQKPMKEHPAPFPLQLVETLMVNTTDENDVVLDPYAGSGTTLVVAKKNNRNYIGIELSRKYCAFAQQRLDRLQPTLPF